MDKKLRKQIIKQIEFLIKVYGQAVRDPAAKERARKHAQKELVKVEIILKELKMQ